MVKEDLATIVLKCSDNLTSRFLGFTWLLPCKYQQVLIIEAAK
jgi:hypothetical protein